MSAVGPKQTSGSALHMSAFGGKADINARSRNVRFMTFALTCPPQQAHCTMLKKGGPYGTRHQYFSTCFGRSSCGDGLCRLGHFQKSFMTARALVVSSAFGE